MNVSRRSFLAGYIHGHDHRWYKTISIRGWGDSRQIRGLCLPSDNKMTPEQQNVIIDIIHRCFQ